MKIRTSLNTSKAKSWNWNFGEIFIWLVWPFGAFIRALLKYRSPASKAIVWLFFVYYGAVFVVPEDKRGAADSARYGRYLKIMNEHPLSFTELQNNIYNANTGIVDIYQPFVTWLVAGFTSDTRLLFLIFASIFGFFYTNNIFIIFEGLQKHLRWHHTIFIIAIALVIPIWYINGVRMYTAAQIFIYGMLKFFFKDDKRGLIWTFLSVFVHFSFMFPVALLVTYIFIPKSTVVFFVFFIVTTFAIELNLYQVRQSLSFLPEVFQPRVEGYTNEELASSNNESSATKSWHIKYKNILSRWYIYFWIVTLFLYREKWLKVIWNGKNLFNLLLFIAGWVQIASNIPSGSRFFILVEYLTYFLTIFIIADPYINKEANRFAKFLMPFLIFVIIIKLRMGLDFIGFLTFIGNLPFAFIVTNQTPVIEFIKSLF